MVLSNQPITLMIGLVRTRYLGRTPNSLATISTNSLPVGGWDAVGTCHVWFHALSFPARATRLFAASGVKHKECRTESWRANKPTSLWQDSRKRGYWVLRSWRQDHRNPARARSARSDRR